MDLFNVKNTQQLMSHIQSVYCADNRPWVVGYSGGKDSTVVTQLIFNSLLGLPSEKRLKPIHIISSDTLVETPLIVGYIDKNLQLMDRAAKNAGLPIQVHKIRPPYERSFWVSMIGRGYPPPRQKFRWCTDRLKIEPANRFILDKVSEFGEVIVVLGVRKSESVTRSQVMESHKVEGKLLRRHSILPNAYVFSPIEDFSVDDVWSYLLQVSSPWGADNNELLSLYQDSQAGECPLVIDKTSAACGNSRFGCWVCTVVKEDKALMGFIENGHEELTPLLEFRNTIQDLRNRDDMREKKRMNGSVYYIQKEGDEQKVGLGPFTLSARQLILEHLLTAEQAVGLPLITDEELALIRQHWQQNGDWEDNLPKIVQRIRGQFFTKKFSERPLFSPEDLEFLDELCVKENVHPELFRKLINLELEHYGYKHRHMLFKNLEKILKQDWVHVESVGGMDLDR